MGSIDDRTEGTTELMRDAVCRSFEPRPEEVGAARRFAAGTVSQWGRDPAGAASVVSELAANAAIHGRTRFTVGVGEDESNIYITVDDDSPRLPTLLHPDRRSLSGRGWPSSPGWRSDGVCSPTSTTGRRCGWSSTPPRRWRTS